MSRLSLTLFQEQCRTPGCARASSYFGVCKEHEGTLIEEEFGRLVESGLTTGERPACFDNHRQWQDYIVSFHLYRQMVGEKNTKQKFDHCRDCTPERKTQMMEEGRCEHRETVFVRLERTGGDLTGVPVNRERISTQAWESAMMGLAGEVVQFPPPEAIEAELQRIAARSPTQAARFRGTRAL